MQTGISNSPLLTRISIREREREQNLDVTWSRVRSEQVENTKFMRQQQIETADWKKAHINHYNMLSQHTEQPNTVIQSE